MPHSGASDRAALSLAGALRELLGGRHVLTKRAATEAFTTGFRFGAGGCLAVIRPGSLIELWRALQLCIAADATVIMQAANTGLTGGSTPFGDDYDRPVVVINTLRLTGIHVIEDGRQVICLAGSTLYDLERVLKPYEREPHSVIGSSCIGASVVGGVCNNSGGALVRRGPAYTEMALYARVAQDGGLELVNHLGVDLGNDPETILHRLDAGDFHGPAVQPVDARRCSDHGYNESVRDIDAPTPARFNADPQRLFEASGSAGKLAVFAVRLDTFEPEAETAVLYVGANDPSVLTAFRRRMLGGGMLPIAAEYLHRDAFDIAAEYGRDMFVAIRRLGTDRLPSLFRAKAWIDGVARRLGVSDASDRAMQVLSGVLGSHLPGRITAFRDRFEHHLMVKLAGDQIADASQILDEECASATGAYFRCTPEEGEAAFLHRFVTAGAAVRYRAVHRRRVGEIVALDIALPRNTESWVEVLPATLEQSILHKLYYGHFFCHVFHQDYVLAKGADELAVEHEMWDLLDARGAEYPAEHNVGHLYRAKPSLADFYKSLDPRNQMNPGLGHTSKRRAWA